MCDGLSIQIMAYAVCDASGPGLSGGDRIFIEYARHWALRGHGVRICAGEEGMFLCNRDGLEGVEYTVCPSRLKNAWFTLKYVERIIRGCMIALRERRDKSQGRFLVYSASDFWPDSLPALIIKRRFRDTVWAAGFYFFAPPLFRSPSDADYRGGYRPPSLRSAVYYVTQRVAYRLIRKYADYVLVCNQLDKEIFVRDGASGGRIMPVYGGVSIDEIEAVPEQGTRYEGCFVGRLHVQKGPLELVRIWKLVCRKKSNARLALIGNGPLEEKVRKEISQRHLEDNVDVLGYVGGAEKFKILKASRVFLHTPVLDTGGMAAAEGMACGLPVVGFDLPGYRYCYPRGMLKAPVGDLQAFADLVLKLLGDGELYSRSSREALEFSREWDWGKKVDDISNAIEGACFNG